MQSVCKKLKEKYGIKVFCCRLWFRENPVSKSMNAEILFRNFFSYFLIKNRFVPAYTELSSVSYIHAAKLFPQICWWEEDFWKLSIAKVDSDYNSYGNRFTYSYLIDSYRNFKFQRDIQWVVQWNHLSNLNILFLKGSGFNKRHIIHSPFYFNHIILNKLLNKAITGHVLIQR